MRSFAVGEPLDGTTVFDLPSALRSRPPTHPVSEAFAPPSLPAAAPSIARFAAPSSRGAIGWRPPTDVLRAGDIVPGSPYAVRRCIGIGGMGEVYEAEHRQLGRRCALKVLKRHHALRRDLAARMRTEARSLARLRHPNLVDVFDLGVTGDGRPYFAMELLQGRDLRAELDRVGVLAVPTALDVVAQALDALACVHAAGIVHRDIKLENVFLCDSGAVKVLDLGVAKLVAGDAPPSRRALVGTPRTMSPEQFAFGVIDARADVYAAGLVLYELVVGRGPFDDLVDDAQALRFAHCSRTPPPPSALAPQPIAADIEAAILRAIAKSRRERFQSAREMADALRELRGERRHRRRGPPPPRARSPELAISRVASRSPTRAAHLLVASSLVVALGAFALACVAVARGASHPPSRLPLSTCAPADARVP